MHLLHAARAGKKCLHCLWKSCYSLIDFLRKHTIRQINMPFASLIIVYVFNNGHTIGVWNVFQYKANKGDFCVGFNATYLQNHIVCVSLISNLRMRLRCSKFLSATYLFQFLLICLCYCNVWAAYWLWNAPIVIQNMYIIDN